MAARFPAADRQTVETQTLAVLDGEWCSVSELGRRLAARFGWRSRFDTLRATLDRLTRVGRCEVRGDRWGRNRVEYRRAGEG